ncbi:MAG: hypothetical protein MZW92_50640 [Comamonadaceae bacterium]|nr:hypothetical protein [Comamonadaceae bacterium]
MSAHFQPRCEPLAGGVSSDIYRVDLRQATYCVKRALPKLKVAADWRGAGRRATATRSTWMRVAARHRARRGAARSWPRTAEAGAFAMEWLAPERPPGVEAAAAATASRWTADGRARSATCSGASTRRPRTGRRRGATSATDDHLPRHPARSPTCWPRRARTRTWRRALDALVETHRRPRARAGARRLQPEEHPASGRDGPVVLDAECAWFGDPAFDLAFVPQPPAAEGPCGSRTARRLPALVRARCVDAYLAARRPGSRWPALDARPRRCCPDCCSARVDGKSPAEYLTADARQGASARSRELPAGPAIAAAIAHIGGARLSAQGPLRDAPGLVASGPAGVTGRWSDHTVARCMPARIRLVQPSGSPVASAGGAAGCGRCSPCCSSGSIPAALGGFAAKFTDIDGERSGCTSPRSAASTCSTTTRSSA